MQGDSLADISSCKRETDVPMTAAQARPTALQIADAIIAHVRRQIRRRKSLAN